MKLKPALDRDVPAIVDLVNVAFRGMADAEEFVRMRGGRRARMSVVNQRGAPIAWQELRGDRLTGATMPFPYQAQCFGRPKRDDLRFAMLEKSL